MERSPLYALEGCDAACSISGSDLLRFLQLSQASQRCLLEWCLTCYCLAASACWAALCARPSRALGSSNPSQQDTAAALILVQVICRTAASTRSPKPTLSLLAYSKSCSATAPVWAMLQVDVAHSVFLLLLIPHATAASQQHHYADCTCKHVHLMYACTASPRCCCYQ